MVHHMVTRSQKQMITRSKRPANKYMAPIRDHAVNRKKKSKKTVIPVALPFGIIIEILSWLSVDTLLRCKCVCKKWCALIQDPYFIAKHLSQSKTVSQYRDLRQGNEERFQWLATHDGLSLEKGAHSHKYRIRNPSMRQILDLPNPHENTVATTFSLAPSSGCYKVISLYDYNDDEVKGFEVLTLGGDDKPSWRSLNAPFFRGFNTDEFEFSWIVSLKGIVHFVTTTLDGPSKYEIVSFNLDNESFTSTTVPRRNVFRNYSRVRMIKWNDYVGLAEIVNQDLRVLLVQDDSTGKWTEESFTIPLKFLKDNPEMRSGLEACSIHGGSIGFKIKRELFIYSIAAERITNRLSPAEWQTVSFVGQPSLVTFKGMKPLPETQI